MSKNLIAAWGGALCGIFMGNGFSGVEHKVWKVLLLGIGGLAFLGLSACSAGPPISQEMRQQEEVAKIEAIKQEELAKIEAVKQAELAKSEAVKQAELAKSEAVKREEIAKIEVIKQEDVAKAAQIAEAQQQALLIIAAEEKTDPCQEIPPDLALRRDAIPKKEPYLDFPNRPYLVLGKVYKPILDNRPYSAFGKASWYGCQFHGKKTSSGELFDMFGFSAAHPTLPIPSYVKVTNMENLKSVIVRINDRGPFQDNRVIDLSFAAAHRIDILGSGTADVEIVRLVFPK